MLHTASTLLKLICVALHTATVCILTATVIFVLRPRKESGNCSAATNSGKHTASGESTPLLAALLQLQ
jgi:hypothetical protein